MTKRITIALLIIAFVSLEASAQNRKHRRRGVILGGLAGAAIGAAIGDKGNNETAGALIGGAVGAVAGGTIGNQKDQRIEHNQRYHSGHGPYTYPQSRYQSGRVIVPNGPGTMQGPYSNYYQPHYFPQGSTYGQPLPGVGAGVLPSQHAARPVTPHDVVAMMRSGMSEPMIIRQIEINGVLRPLSVNEVIELHQLGVGEPILTAMQLANPVPSYEIPTAPAQSPYGPSVVAPSNRN